MTGGALDARVIVGRRAGFRLDATVTAEPGEIVAVMGPSGAGKSTLLAAIAGLVKLDDGKVVIDGWDVASVTPRRHVPPSQRGVVLLGQEPRLFPHLTARENVAFGPRAHGVARDIARGDADEWLWRARWRPRRRCSCSTSRSRRSTPRPRATCARFCMSSCTRRGRPPSS
jgi:molybdate transport system ATP-binding protein